MNSSQRYDVIIVGGGVVGCALARQLALRSRNVLVLEKEVAPAMHTSGRNSGVVHSGFNAKPGSLKADLCVKGNALIREYAKEKKIPLIEVGTCVVAYHETDIPRLKQLLERGTQNGVPGLELLNQAQLKNREPNAKGIAALFSPTGSIIDSAALTKSFAADAQALGVVFRFQTRALQLKEFADYIEVETEHGRYQTTCLINCAGLHADELAHQVGAGIAYRMVPFRGEYFVIQRPIIQSMLYHIPHPELPFLGIHLTKTTNGDILVGPNAVPAFGREAYTARSFSVKDMFQLLRSGSFWKALVRNQDLFSIAVNELRHSFSAKHFYEEASSLVEGLKMEDISSTRHVGIRPQLISQNGKLVDDLVIETTPHSIHFLNVISPGMTCSMAFAQWVDRQLDESFVWKPIA